MKAPWFKVYRNILSDEKIAFLIHRYGHEILSFWIGLMSKVDPDDGVLYEDDEIFAEVCHLEINRYMEIRDVFLKYGLVMEDEDHRLIIINWKAYQLGESTERVRQHRERQRAKSSRVEPNPGDAVPAEERPSNGDETLLKRDCNRDETQLKRSGNGHETTDIDIELELELDSEKELNIHTPRAREELQRDAETSEVDEEDSEAPRPSKSEAEDVEVSSPGLSATEGGSPRTETPRPLEPRTEAPQVSEPSTEAPQVFEPKAETPRASEPRVEAPQDSGPKAKAPRASEPRAEAPEGPKAGPEASGGPAPKAEGPRATESAFRAPGEFAMPRAVFDAWAQLGDRVYQAGDFATVFASRWGEMRRYIRGIHSDDVLAAIRNFGSIVGGPPGQYFWNQRITLQAFLEKHLEKFLPANFRPDDFRVRGSARTIPQAHRPKNPEELDRLRQAREHVYGKEAADAWYARQCEGITA